MRSIVTFRLADRLLGVDVSSVEDVVRIGALSPVPRAAPWIAGIMNVRGRIVTAVDSRARLGLQGSGPDKHAMAIIVAEDGEPFALIVDRVENVVPVAEDDMEAVSDDLPGTWRAISTGFVRDSDEIILEISPTALIGVGCEAVT